MCDVAILRHAYAEELRAFARLRSDALVNALARVPRERFLGPGPWQIVVGASRDSVHYRATADANPSHLYHDVLVAIDAARCLNNGLPSGLAMWIDTLDLQAGETVVHVGCGTGYYTAIMADIVGSSGRVVAFEVDQLLAKNAQANLADWWPQVEVHARDGAALTVAGVDAIIINAGVTHIPRAWPHALRVGGRLLVPLTSSKTSDSIGIGAMFSITATPVGFRVRHVSPVAIFPCMGVRQRDLNDELSRKLGPESRAVRSLRLDAHERDDSCWLHAPETCLSTLPVSVN